MYNPLWLGTPHLSTEDYTYKGKFIPKDSIIVLNTWTIHHDERRYKDAREFLVCVLPFWGWGNS
jgi:cytochrome P450